MLSRSDGSAMLSQGDTSVLVAVYGPAEVKVARELIDRATLEIIFKPKIGLPGCAEKLQERLVRNTCESVILSSLHPRTTITVILQEMQNSGSIIACCINASCLALLDAAIPMRCTVAAVHCIVDEQHHVLLDPTLKQESKAVATFTFAFESRDKNVILAKGTGTFSNELYQKCLSACQTAAADVFALYSTAMRKKLSKMSQMQAKIEIFQ